jgi:hypothetical protein
MKAVIVEIKGCIAAVLSDDGCIVTIKNNNYEIGQVIQMSTPKVRLTKKIAAIAASAAALVVFSVGSWAYASPYSYVSLDVNPSIEYTLNRFDRVLSVKAVNDDGEEILKEIDLDDLQYKNIEEAMTKTVEQISELGYFENTADQDIDAGIIIAISGKDTQKADELAQDLQQMVEQKIEENGEEVLVEAFSVGLERVEKARELGVTPGKLNLVEKLQAASGDPESINIDEWLAKPVKEIMKATKEFNKTASVSGSAITVEQKDTDIDEISDENSEGNFNKADKAIEKAKAAQDKAADKAKAAQDKADDKAKAAQDKAADKAKAAQDKADDKAKAAQDKANDKAKAAQDKADEKEKAAQDTANDKAKKNQDNSNKKNTPEDKTGMTNKSNQDKDDNTVVLNDGANDKNQKANQGENEDKSKDPDKTSGNGSNQSNGNQDKSENKRP